MSPEETSLTSQVRSGLRWSFLNTAVGRAATFLSGIVLARLLSPKDFGIFAVSLVVLQFLLSLNDIGVSACLVRWTGDVDEILGTGTVMAVGVSVLLFGVMFAIAPLFTGAVHAPQATGVVRLMCVGVLIDGVFAAPSAVLTRSLRQDRRAVSDFVVFTTSIGLTLLLAIEGAGPWSLAWGRLAGNLAGGIAIVAITRVRPRVGFEWGAARHMLAFGLPLTGAAVLQFATLNLDNVIVGHVLGPTALGLYVLAFNLSGWPVNVLSDTIRRVSVVAFARLRPEPESVRDGMVRSCALLITITLPICGLLAILAAPLVHFLYGPNWAAAAQPLRFLAVLGGVRVFVELVSDYLIALGHPRSILLIQGLWVAGLIPALTIGARTGELVGVGVGHMVVAAGIVLPLSCLVIRATGVRLPLLAKRAFWPVIATGLALAAVGVISSRISGAFFNLAISGTVGIVLYVGLLWPSRHWILPAVLQRRPSVPDAT